MKLGFGHKVSYVFGPGVGHNCLANTSIFLAEGAKVFILDASDQFSGEAILVILKMKDKDVLQAIVPI